MQSSPTILFAVICGFFLIVIAMIAVVVMVSRNENAKAEKTAKALGMLPVTDHQPFLEKVAYVNGITRPDLYRLTHVFQRHTSSGGDVYMFNFHRRDIKSPTLGNKSRSSKIHYHPLELNALAFVSPLWHLPRFQAMPRLEGEGVLVNLANKAAENLADIKFDVIKFQHIPNLADRYIMSTPETPASQINPPDEFLRVLAANPNLRLQAGGDTMTISYLNSRTQPPDEERMKALYKIGLQLAKDIQTQ